MHGDTKHHGGSHVVEQRGSVHHGPETQGFARDITSGFLLPPFIPSGLLDGAAHIEGTPFPSLWSLETLLRTYPEVY